MTCESCESERVAEVVECLVSATPSEVGWCGLDSQVRNPSSCNALGK